MFLASGLLGYTIYLGDPLGRSARDAILIIISSNSSAMSVLCFARCWTLVFLFLSMIEARFSMSSSIESSFGKNRNRDDFATTNTMTMTTNEGRTGDGERISEERTKTTTRRELLMSKDSEFGEKNKQKTISSKNNAGRQNSMSISVFEFDLSLTKTQCKNTCTKSNSIF